MQVTVSARHGHLNDDTQKSLQEKAEKLLHFFDRLTTIAHNTDLGAGMAVAMKDLEIRGAGNLLGGEQSGHIAGVGFDLYVRLVGEAVRLPRPDQRGVRTGRAAGGPRGPAGRRPPAARLRAG